MVWWSGSPVSQHHPCGPELCWNQTSNRPEGPETQVCIWCRNRCIQQITFTSWDWHWMYSAQKMLLFICCDDSNRFSELERLDVNASICTEKAVFQSRWLVQLWSQLTSITAQPEWGVSVRHMHQPHPILIIYVSVVLTQDHSFSATRQLHQKTLWTDFHSCTRFYDCGMNPFWQPFRPCVSICVCQRKRARERDTERQGESVSDILGDKAKSAS